MGAARSGWFWALVLGGVGAFVLQIGTASAQGQDPAALRRVEKSRDETLWALEVEAQKYGAFVTRVWDRLIAKEPPRDVFASLPFEQLSVGRVGAGKPLPWGGTKTPIVRGGRSFTPSQFQSFLTELESEGYAYHTSEWHQTNFSQASGKPISEYHVVLQLLNPREKRTVVIDAELEIRWSEKLDSQGHHGPERITLQQDSCTLSWATRPSTRHSP
jgi:hypothetical protein